MTIGEIQGCFHLRGVLVLSSPRVHGVFIDTTLLATGGGYEKIPALITRGVITHQQSPAQWLTTGITLIHINRVQSSGSPRGLCLYTSAEFLSLGYLLENSVWYQYLNNLLFLLLELHLHTKTLLLGLLTEQSAQKALITAMMADDPDE